MKHAPLVTPTFLSFLSPLLPHAPIFFLSSWEDKPLSYLCRWTVPSPGCDCYGHWQEELQDREAEQGQLQPLDVDLRGERDGRQGETFLGVCTHYVGLARQGSDPQQTAIGASAPRCAWGGQGGSLWDGEWVCLGHCPTLNAWHL